jgi:hypothetical protein
MKVKVARVDVKLRKFREQPVHLKCSNALEASSIAASAISLATMMRHAADLGSSLKSAIAGFSRAAFCGHYRQFLDPARLNPRLLQ